MNFLVTILNPAENKELKLNTADLFKLFIIVLYKLNNQRITQFPPYMVQRVFKPILPSTEELLASFYQKEHWFNSVVNEIKHSIPVYRNIITSFQFYQYLSSIYRLNIALWIFLSNLDDKNNNGQFELLIDRLHTSDVYIFNDETPEFFLKRIGLEGVFDYDRSSLETLSFSILNNLYDNQLCFFDKCKYIQQAMIKIFRIFNSYTTQVIDTYISTSPLLVGAKDRRITVDKSTYNREYFYYNNISNIDVQSTIKEKRQIENNTSVTANYSYLTSVTMPLTTNNKIHATDTRHVAINFLNKIVNDLGNSNWVVTQSSDNDLMFLALNN